MEQSESYDIIKPDASALESITRAEVDIQISTAKRFPRNIRKAKAQIREIALADEDSSAKCYYMIPRAGKKISGPSIRLAEIVASSWGNMRVATRVMEIGEKDLTVMAVAHDLESNLAVTSEVKKRITNKSGERYSDDMIITTCNAASSVAFRNVVFKTVPQPVWEPVLQDAMHPDRPRPSGPSLQELRGKAVSYLNSLGVSTELMLFKMGRKSVEELDADDLTTLRGYCTSIKEGTSTIDDIFGEEPQSPAKNSINLTPPMRQPGEE